MQYKVDKDLYITGNELEDIKGTFDKVFVSQGMLNKYKEKYPDYNFDVNRWECWHVTDAPYEKDVIGPDWSKSPLKQLNYSDSYIELLSLAGLDVFNIPQEDIEPSLKFVGLSFTSKDTALIREYEKLIHVPAVKYTNLGGLYYHVLIICESAWALSCDFEGLDKFGAFERDTSYYCYDDTTKIKAIDISKCKGENVHQYIKLRFLDDIRYIKCTSQQKQQILKGCEYLERFINFCVVDSTDSVAEFHEIPYIWLHYNYADIISGYASDMFDCDDTKIYPKKEFENGIESLIITDTEYLSTIIPRGDYYIKYPFIRMYININNDSISIPDNFIGTTSNIETYGYFDNIRYVSFNIDNFNFQYNYICDQTTIDYFIKNEYANIWGAEIDNNTLTMYAFNSDDNWFACLQPFNDVVKIVDSTLTSNEFNSLINLIIDNNESNNYTKVKITLAIADTYYSDSRVPNYVEIED